MIRLSISIILTKERNPNTHKLYTSKLVLWLECMQSEFCPCQTMAFSLTFCKQTKNMHSDWG